MKILYVTTIGITMSFFKTFIKELNDKGNTVDIATNESESKVPDCYREWGCKVYSISCSRAPFNKGNIDAIIQIKKLVTENRYDIVHCHTPVAAMCTRLACRKSRKKGTKVFYTVHGFHFYKGAPIINWLIYYPLEWLCGFFTDTLITINKEDFKLAREHIHAKHIEYVPGVGIDVEKFANVVVDRTKKRDEIGVPEDAFVLLSVGELNKNKNHEVVIRAVAELNNPDIHYVIAGKGELHEYLQKLAVTFGVSDRVHLLGYCNEIDELYKIADVYVLPSLREGLNVSVMEAMASGLPCVISKIRGNVDLIKERKGGFLCNELTGSYSRAIDELLRDIWLKKSMGEYNLEVIKEFDVSTIIAEIEIMYSELYDKSL